MKIHALFLLGVVLFQRVFAGDAAVNPNEPDLASQAWTTLEELMHAPLNWQKVHAAEVLIAHGRLQSVRNAFGPELPSAANSAYRVGIWRVMAESTDSERERADWISKIESVLIDPQAKDQPNAIETLCKLQHRVSGPALDFVRLQSKTNSGAHVLLYLWAVQLAGDSGVMRKIADHLRSSDAETREYSAYVLRWLNAGDSDVLRELAEAADRETVGPVAYASVLTAALRLRADATKLDQWRTSLNRLFVETGSSDDRFEACQVLMLSYTPSELAQLTPLLAPRNEADTRIAAAWTILHVLAQ